VYVTLRNGELVQLVVLGRVERLSAVPCRGHKQGASGSPPGVQCSNPDKRRAATIIEL